MNPFKKKSFVFSKIALTEFEKYLITVIERPGVFEWEIKKLSFHGLPDFKLVMHTDRNSIIYVYALFSEKIRVKDMGKGNTIWIKGNAGIYETFFSYYTAEYQKELVNKLCNLN